MIELCGPKECTGCWACINVCPEDCINMYVDFEGFVQPQIDHDRCISCELCQKTCPVLEPFQVGKNAHQKVFAAWNLDESIRMKSSSGGMFSVLADYVLDKNGVVFGATFDQGMKVRHIGIDSKEKLSSLRVSKYVQSDIGYVYRETKAILEQGRLVLFTGTPCQIDGLKRFLNGKFSKQLITVDFVCHGVPSQKSFDSYFEKLTKTHPEIEEFSFRNTQGWHPPRSTVRFKGKTKLLNRSNNVFFRLFLRGYMIRESCYQCQYATTSRIGDITLADFWGLGTEKPFIHDTSKGVNLLIINNSKGQQLIDEVKHNCFLEERTLHEASAYKNPQLTRPVKRLKIRDTILSDWDVLSLEEIEEKYVYPLMPTVKVLFKKARQKFERITGIKRL